MTHRWNAPNIQQFLKYSVWTTTACPSLHHANPADRQWLPSLGSGLIMGGDFLLTASLIYFLRRNRSGVRRCVLRLSRIMGDLVHLLMFSCRTDSMVDIIIMYSISSGEHPVKTFFHAASVHS